MSALAERQARVVVAIDGPDAAGKTTLADRLAASLRDAWVEVVVGREPDAIRELAVYVRISPEESLRRALIRDLGRFGSAHEVERRYRARYLPGQALYRAELDNEGRADVLVDNEDPARPLVLRVPARPGVRRARRPS